MSGHRHQFDTPDAGGDRGGAAAPALWRMRVKETLEAGTGNLGDIVRVVRYDGTTEAAVDYVAVTRGPGEEIDRDIYVFQPAGGTGRKYEGRDVQLLEIGGSLPPGKGRYKVLMILSATTHVKGWDYLRFPPET